jgi:hypothetical protein
MVMRRPFIAAHTTRCRKVGASTLAIVLAGPALMLGCTRSEEKPLPADPKARAEFVAAQGAKLPEDSRRLLDRFMLRVKNQEASGGPSPTVSIAKAIELQRAYDSDVATFQKRYQERLSAAKADLRVDVRERSLVNEDVAKSPSGKAVRYVLDVTNTGKRVIDRVALRVDFRDASGKYLASVPDLELKGPLKPGEAGRSVQLLPINPTFQTGLLEGRLATIGVTPSQITYEGGEKVDPGEDLKSLELLSRTRIP